MAEARKARAVGFNHVALEMVGATGGPDALREQCEAALVKAKLKPGAMRATFMKPFGKAEPKAK